ncbi:hypothetical protein YC2023_025356 [Brassica napus]
MKTSYVNADKPRSKLNRTSWSGGKKTSAEVSAITSSSSGHSRFNMVFVWFSGLSLPVLVGCGGIVGVSERNQKKMLETVAIWGKMVSSIMLIWAMYSQYIPRHIRSQMEIYFYKLLGWLSFYVHIKFR